MPATCATAPYAWRAVRAVWPACCANVGACAAADACRGAPHPVQNLSLGAIFVPQLVQYSTGPWVTSSPSRAAAF
jgi:hypothetical protein